MVRAPVVVRGAELNTELSQYVMLSRLAFPLYFVSYLALLFLARSLRFDGPFKCKHSF